MTILKSILGLIIGAVVGVIVAMLGFLAICIVAGLVMWDARRGEGLANIIAPFFIPLGAIIGFIFPLWEESSRKAEQARQEAESRRHAAEQHAATQRALALQLTNVISESTQTATDLPKLVRAAERTIDLAEQEFRDGAFAPFWDAVEQAANKLASFEDTMQRLIQNSHFYTEEAPKLETPPPPFQLGLQTLPDASHTANRMRAVVRRAQKDFHFATIYEQRKTNQLLVAGFSSLGQAINELGDRLDSSLDRLSSAVSVGISEITASHERMTSALTAEHERSREQSREQAERDSEAHRDHEKKEREMLDNIQRRRKPWP